MSTIYNTEPPTKGKVRCSQSHAASPIRASISRGQAETSMNCDQVVLHTSFGDLDIELWPKEAPKVSNGLLADKAIGSMLVSGQRSESVLSAGSAQLCAVMPRRLL